MFLFGNIHLLFIKWELFVFLYLLGSILDFKPILLSELLIYLLVY